jgi:GrpB-like predicted nucleotidyltransferase (UPF0157 family)
MNKSALGNLYPIQLVNYNDDWHLLFLKEKSLLKQLFNQTLRIEHVGSTAIKGIMAKPTIDILFEKPVDLSNEKIIETMAQNRYIHMEELNNHLMFVKGYSPSGLEKESFHIHMGFLNQTFVWDRIFFCNYLNHNPDELKIYEILKKELAFKYKNDREAYTHGKEEYINRITAKAKAMANPDSSKA